MYNKKMYNQKENLIVPDDKEIYDARKLKRKKKKRGGGGSVSASTLILVDKSRLVGKKKKKFCNTKNVIE